MLGLKLATDPRWVNIVESNIEEILTDHAFCEQKAASNAISLIILYPEYDDIVQNMALLAQEEMDHFKQVHDIILQKGLSLGKERKDSYVNELVKFMRKGMGKERALMDRLLFAAMIEARSCERFKILSQNIKEKKLSDFYHRLMVSEANHYTLFIKLAKKYNPHDEVDKRWKEWLEYEADVISRYGKSETVHG